MQRTIISIVGYARFHFNFHVYTTAQEDRVIGHALAALSIIILRQYKLYTLRQPCICGPAMAHGRIYLGGCHPHCSSSQLHTQYISICGTISYIFTAIFTCFSLLILLPNVETKRMHIFHSCGLRLQPLPGARDFRWACRRLPISRIRCRESV